MHIDEFIRRQLELWPGAAQRHKDLESVDVKQLTICGEPYAVQFNPARAVSTRAKVDAKSIAERPCFLCAKNRPKEQIVLEWEDLDILVNPFPIFPGHLTIAAREHTPQTLEGRSEQMRRLSRALPGYTIFYNGAKCGASAPDHMHFQAVPSRYMRVPKWIQSYELPEADFSAEEIDPMVNAVCTDGVITVIPRRKHRPDCYDELPVSPACIDLCGTLIAVRQEDFDRLDDKIVEGILREVTMPHPSVYVNIVGGKPMDDEGRVRFTIGKDFHWQQEQERTFAGELLKHGEELINRVDVEEYLRSVISSEMSATSSAELLKAHAVISRSWLLAQMRATRELAEKGREVPSGYEPGDMMVWWDRDDHEGFDVCSDDHCQRYQGVPEKAVEAVDAAIEATSGLVLTTCDGNICDARFSKCCGGAFELFENCWQPNHHDYLVAHADSRHPLDLPDLTQEEEARKWILGQPKAWCNCEQDAEVLNQVLNGYDRNTTPNFYRWEARYTLTELSDLIEEKSGVDFGEILRLEPLSRGTSGRIWRLRIVGTKETRVIGKELLIRKWLSKTHLLSSAFVIDRDGTDFVLRGAGWGHGVGLCQIGAAKMAASGIGFREILAHYFPGAELRKLY